jgi:ABC-2 type transport system ATP-binding protein
MLEGLRSTGTSILLTTHYMEEAQHLCDRVAIMASGRIVAEGTASSLISLAGTTTIRFASVGLDISALSRATDVAFQMDGDVVSATVTDAQEALLRLLRWSESESVHLDGLEVLRPSLDDVFLDVTGRDR